MFRFLLLSSFVFAFFQSTIEHQISEAPVHRVDELDWLVGSWVSANAGVETEEYWIGPKGGMMLGVNRTTGGDKAQFEFMRLQDQESTVFFYASPSGGPATGFKLKSIGEKKVLFENLKNDFPQRIHYQRKDDKLHAYIEGEVDGKSRRIQWVWNLRKSP